MFVLRERDDFIWSVSVCVCRRRGGGGGGGHYVC